MREILVKIFDDYDEMSDYKRETGILKKKVLSLDDIGDITGLIMVTKDVWEKKMEKNR